MYLRDERVVFSAVKLMGASLLLALGICLYVEVGLGSDSIDVLLDGMTRTWGITLGQANLIFVATTLVIALVVNRKAVGIPSIISGVAASLLIDVINTAIVPLALASQNIVVRGCALCVGQLAMGGAYGILQTIAHGTNITDAIVRRTSEVMPGSYMAWRMLYDVVFMLMGVALGGVFGAGTVFYVVTNGATIKVAISTVHRVEAVAVHALCHSSSHRDRPAV